MPSPTLRYFAENVFDVEDAFIVFLCVEEDYPSRHTLLEFSWSCYR